MNKPVSFKNCDRFIQLGVAIGTLRRIRGLSQQMLAKKANISRTSLALIEAPNVAYGFSLEIFFNLAVALDIAPEKLIATSKFTDDIINTK